MVVVVVAVQLPLLGLEAQILPVQLLVALVQRNKFKDLGDRDATAS